MSDTATKKRSARMARKQLVPSAKTVAAMKAARRGELTKVGKPEKLLGRLGSHSGLGF